MATISIEYGKQRANGGRAVMLRIRSGKTEKRIPLNIILDKSDYRVYPDGRIKITNDEKYFLIQDSYSDFQRKANEILRDSIGIEISANDLYDRLTKPSAKEVATYDFFVFADRWLSQVDIKGKKNYITMLNSLSSYLGTRHLPFSSITYQLLNGFSNYLKDKPRAQSLYLGGLRHLYKQAALLYNTDDHIVLSPNLFERFKTPKQKKVGQRAIEADELKKFFALIPNSGRAELAIDCCLLSFCLMGTNSVDLYNAKYYKGEIFAYERTKTRERRIDKAYIEIIVDDRIKPLFDKYRAGDHSHVFNFSERYADETQFNRAINIGLRDLQKKYGGEKYQFYQFRHSWASIARNNLGADKSIIHDALNHVSNEYAIDDLYIKKDFRQINQLNSKVIRYLFGSDMN